MVRKSVADTLSLEITSLGAQGDGVGTSGENPVYVANTVPGDKITAEVQETKRNGIYAELVSVDEPSVHRVDPVCSHFGKCGGCQLQYLEGDFYRSWVKERAVMALAHHGFDGALVRDPVITPEGSRRRVALKALKLGNSTVLGFNAHKSHQIIDLKECFIARSEITSLLKPLRSVLNTVLKVRNQAEVHLTLTATGIDMLVDAPIELDLAAREALVDFANDHDLAAIHWRDQGFLDPVIIRRNPVMDMAGAMVGLKPASFIQASEEGENALVTAVVEACKGYGRVADLFCGMGTFTFPLAKDHQVLAVEGAKQPLDSLQAGANFGVGFKQIIAKHRDLFRRPMTGKELSAFEAVVFDPPRAGAKEQAQELANSDVKRIVAVSCNPNTFSRDARFLADGGYTLEYVLPVDQFLWSPHLELVGVFTKA